MAGEEWTAYMKPAKQSHVRLLFGRRSIGHALEFAGMAVAVVGWLLLTPVLIGLRPDLDIERIWELVAIVPGTLVFFAGYIILNRDA
jgi:hypothetical protein